jgi:hypothetical protein
MKTVRILAVATAALAVLLAACGPAAAPAPEVVVVKETVVVEQPAAPQAEAPAAAPQPQYAPICQTAATGCQPPEVEMLDNKYCVKKIPYAIMSVPAGTTYESLDPDMKCQDQEHSDGSLRITCSSGEELWSYNLKLCNGACAAPALDMNSGQCQQGYGYDAANGCCAPPAPSGDAGCVVYQVDIGACPLPQ